jgi:hypothetical protein
MWHSVKQTLFIIYFCGNLKCTSVRNHQLCAPSAKTSQDLFSLVLKSVRGLRGKIHSVSEDNTFTEWKHYKK